MEVPSSARVRKLMPILHVAEAVTAHPFGDERSVNQAFPSAVPAEITDPFLMCDDFAMTSTSLARHPDYFPIKWHPHAGFDIVSYIKSGVGRHGDSLGNRETVASPGLQWMNCGSGIEHAEGGGTRPGEQFVGFQIWVNVPAERKRDTPQYGTVPPQEIAPITLAPGVAVRLIAGPLGKRVGPFRTVAENVQILDFELMPETTTTHEIPEGMDCALLYVYGGGGSVEGKRTSGVKVVFVLDATDDEARVLQLVAGPEGMSALLFAGKKLREPIAWNGPIVMNTLSELQDVYSSVLSGTFPPVRVSWNYKRIADFPVQDVGGGTDVKQEAARTPDNARARL